MTDLVDRGDLVAEGRLREAGLRAARVIIQSAGLRIAANRGHVTAIDAADAITGGANHRRVLRLHQLRRMRHEFTCETRPAPSASDLDTARRDVEARSGRSGRDRAIAIALAPPTRESGVSHGTYRGIHVSG